MAVDVVIRAERSDDVDAIRAVVAAAFGADVVADLVDGLRASSHWRAELSLVAEADDDVVGHVSATHAWLDAPASLVDVLVLSPLSVEPSRQRQGIGAALVRRLLDVVRERDEPAIFLEGSPAYYSRFGFEPAGDYGVRRPSLRIPAAAFQVVWLTSTLPRLTGTLVYPEVFWALDCVGLR